MRVSCIDLKWFVFDFGGTNMPECEFSRLADIAITVIRKAALQPIHKEDENREEVKKAVAHQIEYMYQNGGDDIFLGLSGGNIASESLGDYSVSINNQSSSTMKTINGIPVAPASLLLLEEAGYMSRWAYATAKKRCELNDIE